MTPSDSAHRPTRLTIVLDIDDTNTDLVGIWAGLHVNRLIAELWDHGVNSDVVSISTRPRCQGS